jgi:hypothetical protein
MAPAASGAKKQKKKWSKGKGESIACIPILVVLWMFHPSYKTRVYIPQGHEG